MEEGSSSTLLQDAARKLVSRVSRSEIPEPVARSLAAQAAGAVLSASRMFGIDDPTDELRSAFGIDPNAPAGAQSDQLSDALAAAVDVVWPHPADRPSVEEPPRSSRGPEPRDQDVREEVAKKLDELFQDHREAFEEFAAFEDEVGGTDDDVVHVAARWELERVKTILTRMLVHSREVGLDDPEREVKYPHRVRFEDSLSREIELMELDVRVELASRLAEQARQNPDFRSPGRAVGNDVHSALQDRYLMARSPTNVVVQEWWIYFPGSRARRSISEQARRELRETDPAKRDYTFVVIEKARLPPRGPIGGKNRWDVLDLTLAQLYEIKPLVRMHEGVLQESYYRYKYCYCALYLLDPELEYRVLVPWIDPGKAFPITDPLTRELLITTRFGAIALPFQIMPAIPAIIPYVVLRRTQETDVVRLLLRVMAWIREKYKAIRKALQRLRAKILVAILITLLVVLVVVLVLVILGRALAEAPKPPSEPRKGLPPPQDQPVPPIGAPDRDPVFAPRGVAAPTFISVRPAADYRSLEAMVNSGSSREETMRCVIGGIEVEGLPVSRFGEFMTKAADGIDAALAHLTRLAAPETGAPLV
jgi:hypothetical protein